MKQDQHSFVCQNMRFQIRSLMICLAVCLLIFGHHFLALADEVEKDKERQIASSSPIDIPNIPLADLSDVLRKDVKNKRFRVKWFYSAGSFYSNGQAVYNRRDNTLIECVIHQDDVRANRLHILFSGVTDAMIHQASKDWGMKGSGPFSFDLLVRYGAVSNPMK